MANQTLKQRVEELEKTVQMLSNTLHVVDGATLLAVYSLISTQNLRQPNFKTKQDIIDSGCSDAINRVMKTVTLVNLNEKKRNEDKS